MEKAICADAALAAADRQMAELYRARLAAQPGDAGTAVRQEQQAWLRRRQQCESEAEASPALARCVQAAIAERIAALRPPAAPPAPPPPAAAREPTVPRATGTWVIRTDGASCSVSRGGPHGRRFAIERRADAAAGQPGVPVFQPGPADQDLVLPGDRVVFLVGQQRLAAVVAPGGRIVAAPGTEAAALPAILAGDTLAVVRLIDTLLQVPLDGLGEAYRRMAERCGG
ncbi:hypothetical protein STVA_26620 [Allostella vacuolata]|nr:hypothetical protein STVA_26620 [Stella vacuolata]